VQERLWDLLNNPVENNTAQTVIVRLSDGTNPFLFMRDPISQTWMIFRETEQDIVEVLNSPGFCTGSEMGKDGVVKGNQSNVKTIFPEVQLVEVESERVFANMLLSRAKEKAVNSYDRFEPRVMFYERLKHLLEGDTD
jgi:hypothetical protein